MPDINNLLGLIGTIRANSDSPLAAYLSSRLIQAMFNGWVYGNDTRTTEWIMKEWSTEENYGEFLSRFEDDSLALFNHGDGQIEEVVVGMFPLDEDGETMIVMFERNPNDRTEMAIFAFIDKEDSVVASPHMVYTAEDRMTAIHGWDMCPDEYVAEMIADNTKAMVWIATGLCLASYLDEQIEGDRTGEKFGDGLHYLAGVTMA
jgi:hypothetical protein